MITIKDVAAKAGVSPATVSRVLNNGSKVGSETRARVRLVIDELGFHPNANARDLAAKRSSVIGAVITDILDPFSAALVQGLEVVAKRHNLRLLISSGAHAPTSELDALDMLIERRVDTMVVQSRQLDDTQLIALASQIPGFVLFNRQIPSISDRCVWLDEIAGGRMMAQHVVNNGHTRIAVISNRYQSKDALHRIEGIRQALSEHDLGLPDSHIEYDCPSYQGGVQAMHNLLTRGISFTALLTYNDAMAAGAMSVLMDHQLQVPNDISVVGNGDVAFAQYSTPKLTTLRNPGKAMAIKAGEMALSYAATPGTEVSKNVKYTPTIIQRESVRKCKTPDANTRHTPLIRANT